MTEAAENKYFVDGFLIKHFGIFPIGFNKEDLFEEQKIFLVYLMGFIPSIQDWTIQVDYQVELQKIKDIKTVDISPEDIDLAKMQGKDINELKKDRLNAEKIKKIAELNKKYGLKDETPETNDIPDIKEVIDQNNPKKLWDILQGKGLLKNGL